MNGRLHRVLWGAKQPRPITDPTEFLASFAENWPADPVPDMLANWRTA